MVRVRSFALAVFMLAGIFQISGQKIYSSDVVCNDFDGSVALIYASGLSDKKKGVYENALKSIFNALL